jgi:hypothetical protein
VLGKTPVAVPARHQDHVVGEILSLDLSLLENDDVGLEKVEHGGESAPVAPWLVAKGVTDAVDVPSHDTEAHGGR